MKYYGYLLRKCDPFRLHDKLNILGKGASDFYSGGGHG